MSVPVDLLLGFAPLRALRPQSRAELARSASRLDLRAGEYLFMAGDTGTDALFLLRGELQLETPGQAPVLIVSGDARSQDNLCPRPPHRTGARCLSDVGCIRIDANLLEIALTWDSDANVEVGEVRADTAAAGDWMLRLLQLRTFAGLPAGKLQAMFLAMDAINVAPGEVVIRQGDPGDYFYVIEQGRCQVVREVPRRRPVQLAVFKPGDCFGEEALISGASRSATVTALDHGKLLRLSKAAFNALLNEPLTRLISFGPALQLVASGQAAWIDVRPPSDCQSPGLDGALAVPTYLLRLRAVDLDRRRSYICVCENGSRARVASYLLTQLGFDSHVLDGGLAAAAR